MGTTALNCCAKIFLLARHFPYARMKIFSLIFASMPIMYQLYMIKFVHYYFAASFMEVVQVLGGYPAVALIFQTCTQFSFVFLISDKKIDPQLSCNLQNAADYIKDYNLFMFVHLLCVQSFSLMIGGWNVDILFLGFFELGTRIWGFQFFKDISGKIAHQTHDNLHDKQSRKPSVDNSRPPHSAVNCYACQNHEQIVSVLLIKEYYPGPCSSSYGVNNDSRSELSSLTSDVANVAIDYLVESIEDRKDRSLFVVSDNIVIHHTAAV